MQVIKVRTDPICTRKQGEYTIQFKFKSTITKIAHS